MSPPLSPVRTRNAAATRTAILEAARRRFAHEGYDQTGLRDIAGDAGVDAALISRYFGGKDELFAEVLACSPNIAEFLEGDREGFGERVAQVLAVEPMREEKFELFLIMLRSVSSPKAAETIRIHSQQAFFQPLQDWLGDKDAAVRARLLSCVMMGATMNRMIHEDFLLDDQQRRELCAGLARTLDHYVSGEI
ncbi:TetR/AcrR family transcriptional regulator [Phenylobacterium sp.]|uniref:TetR/AcrR family transcriptional regulator n=1 Tax=Phenylobacterium sp. TaxID=1871053 RepID=UPI0027310784|nr:TetR/AcrR family transcriptional regulator [Phenylobacterium sp.]MDP1875489.1 TetR family transcriptional regulator [Phenylobacterium sp.]MDP3489101.1 TetR family transcriptional regulator [Phenylobacterium sp.]